LLRLRALNGYGKAIAQRRPATALSQGEMADADAGETTFPASVVVALF